MAWLKHFANHKVHNGKVEVGKDIWSLIDGDQITGDRRILGVWMSVIEMGSKRQVGLVLSPPKKTWPKGRSESGAYMGIKT